MDNLTHCLTGLALSRAGLNRITPHATALLVLAANAPDVDLITALGGPLTYLHYHRHLTHSLLLAPLLPVACVLAVSGYVRLRKRTPLPWSAAYFAAFLGVVSHLILDLTNIYGVRLCLPFSGRWFSWDITSVVDLWIWAVLLISVLGPALGRLVNVEMGVNRKSANSYGHGFAIFALCFLLLYDAGRAVLHARARAMLDSRIYSGSPPLRVAAMPHLLNPFHWRGLVETAEYFSFLDVDLLGDFDPAGGQIFYKSEHTGAREANAIAIASRSGTYQQFLKFAQYPIWRVSPAAEVENGVKVEVMDLRFGTPLEPAFVCIAILDARLQVVRTWFTFGKALPR